MRSDAATDDLAASASKRPAGGGGRREILLRVLSAAVLAPAGLWAAWTGGLALVLGTGLCAVLASVEWTRMAAQLGASWARIPLYVLMGVGAAVAVWAGTVDLALVAVVGLVLAGLAGGLAHLGNGAVRSMAFGAVYVTLPFGAFVWIRDWHPDGQWILLALLAVVWATDIAAYFAGRGFGGPLLAPKDSPNKTWTGAIGAVVCACLAGAAVARLAGGDLGLWLFVSLLISVVAQAGDLLESRCKRLYGVKDTSGFVPGHGGVLDRLDALMAASVFVALLIRFLPGVFPGFVTGDAG
jgi:phosphatidate cytidylyltransferase